VYKYYIIELIYEQNRNKKKVPHTKQQTLREERMRKTKQPNTLVAKKLENLIKLEK